MKKKVTGNAKRKKNLRTTVAMMGVSVMLLSGATYAWFTLSNTASITNLSLGVTEASNLEIIATDTETSLDGTEPGWSTILDLKMTGKAKLSPATLDSDFTKVLKPEFSGNVITKLIQTSGDEDILSDTEVANSDTESKGYYYDKYFALQIKDVAEGQQYTLSLEKGVFAEDTSPISGTYIVKGDEDTDPLAAANCVRIAFYSVNDSGDATLLFVYEPNSDITGTSDDKATASDSDITNADSITYKDYIVSQISGSNGTTNDRGTFKTPATSTSLSLDSNHNLQLSNNWNGKPTKYLMRVFLEGKDDQCVNEAAAQSIIGNIQFTADKKTS